MANHKKGEKKPKPKPVPALNFFASLEGKDGNPNTPKEFDESHHGENEVYFKADDGATEAVKNKILILNFIHQELHYDTERAVPVLTKQSDKDLEIYHEVEYQGVKLQVCVYWPSRAEGEFKSCISMVKFASDDLSSESEDAGSVVAVDVSWNKPAKKDKFTTKVDGMTKNYWAPRWKYVVKSLRDIMANDFEKNGVDIIHPETEPEEDDAAGGTDNGEEIEEEMMVFSGATGKIIGPKGAKIQEIKGSSKVKEIKMPTKNEDAPRPKARELVAVMVIGTKTAVKKAKKLIQEVVDEWANAPRPPRDGGASHGGGGADSYQAPAADYIPPDFTNGGGWDATPSGGDAPAEGGGPTDWADDAIAAAPAVGGDAWDAGGGGEQW